MRTRPVIVVSVVVLAAVALVWYVALAPSRASFVEPGPSELAVTATQNGNGSWVRYLVNVKNLGDVGYDGDVVLVNRIQGSAAPGTSPAVMPYTHAVPPAAMSIGTAAVPAVAPDSAYEAHVTVPSRQEVTVSFFAPPGYAQAEALDNSGQPLGGTSVERNDTIPIAVISDSATAADQLAALSIADVPLTVFDFRRGRGFPADASLLAG
jgi:hypothetical protein